MTSDYEAEPSVGILVAGEALSPAIKPYFLEIRQRVHSCYCHL